MALSVPVSDRFLHDIRYSHEVFAFVDVIGANNQTYRLHTTDGNVQEDRTADIRRRANINCVDPTGAITPTTADSILTPFGAQIRPYRGIKYPDGTTEVVPLGWFFISKSQVSDVPGGASSSTGGTPGIAIEAYDAARKIQRAKFVSPYTIAVGTNVVAAIQAIIARTFDNLEYDVIDTTVVTPAVLTFDVDSDPWAAATGLATSIGCELFFDVLGRVVIAPPLDVDALPSPDFSYIDGHGSSLLDLEVIFTDDPGYNGVVLTSDAPGDDAPPIRSVVWDEEPTSPTYHQGAYGEVPFFVTDNTITTQDQADAACAALLATLLGYASQLAITTAVNPALCSGSVIQVHRPRTGVMDTFLVDGGTTPMLANETMNLVLRQRRTT